MPRLIGPGFLTVLAVGALLTSGGQALASHVDCGDVITADTTLDSDLIDCPSDGIVIGADNITLDLARHTIDGSAARPQAGIDNDAGHAGVKIEPGRVQGFDFGVRPVRASDGRLRNLTVSDTTTFGISLTDSDRNSGAAMAESRYPTTATTSSRTRSTTTGTKDCACSVRTIRSRTTSSTTTADPA